MRIADTAIRNANPREKSYKLSDGGGLVLIINPSGFPRWRLRYCYGGREKMLSLGIYPRCRSRTLATSAKRLTRSSLQRTATRVGFTTLEIDILPRLASDKQSTSNPSPTLKSSLRQLARLGGYLDRVGDGQPGNLVMWRHTAERSLSNFE